MLKGKGESNVRKGYVGFQNKVQKSIVNQQYKLISIDGEVFELYDLLSDPNETKNVAKQNTKVVVRMKSELEAWINSCKNSDDGNDY